jgi:MinD-like ATPase involved in chromosome partitioning or flagellar assembly
MNWNVNLKWDYSPYIASQNDLARFVINHATGNPALDSIRAKGEEELKPLTTDPVFDGYLSNNIDKVYQQVHALYLALHKHEPELVWTSQPQAPAPMKMKQSVRASNNIIENHSADCIDIVYLMACLLFKIGLNPLITIVGKVNDKEPTHAILGYWLKDGSFPSVKVEWDKAKSLLNSIAFVDATGVLRGNKKPFAEASAEALGYLPLDAREYVPLPADARERAKQLPLGDDGKVFYMVDVRRMYLDTIVACPVIAIMGTKGGVGKTSIAARMAELIAETNNNALIIDLDVEGTSSTGSTRFHCNRAKKSFPTFKTVWDHLLPYSQGVSVDISSSDDRLWDVTPPYLKEKNLGKIFLLPARPSEWKTDPYDVVANIPEPRNDTLLKAVNAMLQRAQMSQDEISCVIIDCGAGLNPVYSAAFHLADYGYIVTLPVEEHFEAISEIKQLHQKRYSQTDRWKIKTIVNRFTSKEDKARCTKYNPVGYIPDDPQLQKDYYEDAVYFDLGYTQFSAEIRNILDKEMQGVGQRLVPDEIDVWLAPWLNLNTKDYLHKELTSWFFRVITFLSLFVPIVTLGATIFMGYWNFLTSPSSPVSEQIDFAANAIRVARAFGFLLSLAGFAYSVALSIRHLKRRRLLVKVVKSKVDNEFIKNLLSGSPKKLNLKWLKNIIEKKMGEGKKETQKERAEH